VTERSHLSIGEVLNLLQDEFPDITISKIRFLESQGLLDPERTPSGYRKFYEEDIERLRWILRQQKENFLPLKVIKERLASGQLDEPAPAPVVVPAVEPDPDPVVADAATPARGRASASRASRSTGRERVRPPEPLLDSGPTGVSLTRDEVMAAAGLSTKELADLERYDLVTGRPLGNTVYYGDEALVVAKLAAGFMSHGVEARHLRMYKVAAEREAGVFEQLVVPLLKQRNPAARQQATEKLDELAGLGSRLRDALLRAALQDHLGTP
jgi:DNA-binding transcriptional MerR regulator